MSSALATDEALAAAEALRRSPSAVARRAARCGSSARATIRCTARPQRRRRAGPLVALPLDRKARVVGVLAVARAGGRARVLRRRAEPAHDVRRPGRRRGRERAALPGGARRERGAREEGQAAHRRADRDQLRARQGARRPARDPGAARARRAHGRPRLAGRRRRARDQLADRRDPRLDRRRSPRRSRGSLATAPSSRARARAEGAPRSRVPRRSAPALAERPLPTGLDARKAARELATALDARRPRRPDRRSRPSSPTSARRRTTPRGCSTALGARSRARAAVVAALTDHVYLHRTASTVRHAVGADPAHRRRAQELLAPRSAGDAHAKPICTKGSRRRSRSCTTRCVISSSSAATARCRACRCTSTSSTRCGRTSSRTRSRRSAGKGTIAIETARRRRLGVVVRVIDDGPGVPPDVLPRIFEPFFTTKPKGEGTGPRASGIARQIVAKHGGELRCESRPGRTCFEVRLPIAGAPRRDERARKSSSASTTRRACCASLRAQLGARFGHECQIATARSGDEAVALFDELTRDGEAIAVVIADQIMPGMKGVELLEIVDRRLPDDHEDPADRPGRPRRGDRRDQPRAPEPVHRQAVGRDRAPARGREPAAPVPARAREPAADRVAVGEEPGAARDEPRARGEDPRAHARARRGQHAARAARGHRRPDRPLQPPPLSRAARARGRAQPAQRAAAVAAHARRRPLQAVQRRVRPPGGRRGAAPARARARPTRGARTTWSRATAARSSR